MITEPFVPRVLPRGHPHGGDHNASDPTVTPTSSPTAASNTTSPLAIAGFSAAGAALLALIVWLTLVFLRVRAKRARPADEEKRRGRIPAEWMISQPQIAFNRTSFFSRARTRSFTPLPDPQSNDPRPRRPGPAHPVPARLLAALDPPRVIPYHHTRTLSRDEMQILAHHTANNTLPRPFAPLGASANASAISQTHNQPSDARAAFAPSHSATDSIAAGSLHGSRSGSASDMRRGSASRPPSTPQRILSHFRAQPFSIGGSSIDSQLPRAPAQAVLGHSATNSFASSFSFASMPYRTSGAPSSPQRQSFATSLAGVAAPKRPMIQPGTHQVYAPFVALLPDEVELSVGERVTVVDAYPDGWCVVLRSGAVSGGEVQLGAVPAWCFDKPVDGSSVALPQERPERIASLGVTVAVEGPDHDSEKPPDSKREKVFSWTNL